MEPFEDRLRQVLRREAPPPDLADRVIRAAQARGRTRRTFLPAALAAGFVFAAFGAAAYQEHREQERVQAEQARAQLVLALRISSERLNGAFRRIAPPQEQP